MRGIVVIYCILVIGVTGEAAKVDIYKGCVDDKTCLGLPVSQTGCVKSKNCQQMVTYIYNPVGPGAVAADSKVQSEIKFELYSSDATKYAAVGFSNDKEMGGDAVIKCFNDGKSVQVVLSENVDKFNMKIPVQQQMKLKATTKSMADGKLICAFSLPGRFKAGDTSIDFNGKYYILLAGGPVTKGDIGKHRDKMASAKKISIANIARDIEKELSNSADKDKATIGLLPVIKIYLALIFFMPI